MKKVLIVSIFSIFLANCSSDELSTSTNSNNERVVVANGNQSLENNTDFFAKPIKATTEILISNTTRGFSSSVTIKDGSITKTSTGIVPPTTTQISGSKWNVLKQKFAVLNLVKIPTYIAPSCLTCTDMVLSQTLEIKHNGVTYTSQTYDSTNPPSQLKDFLAYVKTLN